MWKPIRRLRIFPDFRGPVVIRVQGVKREDGFTVIREITEDPVTAPYERAGWETFSCKGYLGKCRFIATRKEAGQETGIYRILLNHMESPDADMCQTYASDIEDALLHGWPWQEIFDGFRQSAFKVGIKNPRFIPLTEVRFVT